MRLHLYQWKVVGENKVIKIVVRNSSISILHNVVKVRKRQSVENMSPYRNDFGSGDLLLERTQAIVSFRGI